MEGAGLKKEEPVEVEIEDLYPLSPTQQGMLFHSLESPNSGMYFNQVCYEFDATLNIQALEQSWQKMLDRHSILRTAFVWEDLEEPLQVVCRNLKLPVRQEDWRKMADPEQAQRLESFLLADRLRGFNLSEAPLMRLTVIRVADDRFNFIWSHHHLLLDGWSVPSLLKELFDTYTALYQGKELELPPAPSYAEYIDWLGRRDLSEAESFWRQTLKGFTAPTRIGVDSPHADAAMRTTDYDDLGIRLSEAETDRLQAMSRQHRLTLNTIVQGAWALLLSRYSGDDDIVFGTTFSGRPLDLPGAETMIGLFINLLPVRAQVNAEEFLLPWLGKLQDLLVEMQKFQFSPLIRIQEWSEAPRRMPLFELILGFENSPVVNRGRGRYMDNPLLGLRTIERTNYPLSLKAFPGPELGFEILYDCGRFARETIAGLLDHLRTLLESMATNPDQRLGEISLLNPAERHQLLAQWNDTRADYPRSESVVTLFEAQARNSPDALAVEFQGQQVSFAELNARANQLAHYLIENGVGPEMKTGICMERSIEMLVGIFGVLKAGGAFVPLDPTYPAERLNYILADTAAGVVLSQQRLVKNMPESGARVICLDEGWDEVAGRSRENPYRAVEPEHLAYIIYTSGSTGLPKGVMVTHQGFANYVLWSIRAYALEAGQGAPVHSPLTFDLTITSVFPPLAAGKTVLLIADDQGVEGLSSILKKGSDFSLLKITPSHLEVLSQLLRDEDLEGVARRIIIGGEALLAESLAFWKSRAPGTRLINEYGPTETVVGCCVYEVRDDDPASGAIPIGRPIANTQLYLLDSRMQPVPVGVGGELLIGGDGLARGYLNRPETTAEKFVPNPFASEPGARLYKTGDIARYLPDSNIEFLGRTDDQVKVRGFRIELGEIEAALSGHPSVRECAVVVREASGGDKQLVGYAAVDASENLTSRELRTYLLAKLPEYMAPTTFILLEALPLTANGKIDRKNLPSSGEESRSEGQADYLAPRDAVEQQLAEIWENLLEIRHIGVRSSFFDLGGHSLTAVRLLAQIQKRFGQELPLNSLMRASTIEAMAGLIRDQVGSLDWSPVVEIQRQGSGHPFFCVHPAGGNVLRYRHLAQYLGRDQPFYGLEAPGLADDRNHYVLIESLAAYYIEHIKKIQPEGPYFLGGHSFGGFVAFEMAQQLQRQGEAIGLLALIDTPAPSFINKAIDDATLFAGRIREIGREIGINLPITRDEIKHLDREGQINYLIDYLRQNGLLSEDMDEGWIGRYLEGLRARERAVLVYKPDYCEGRITLFRASEIEPDAVEMNQQQGLDINDPSLGWEQLASEPVEVHYIPGFHDTIMFEPNVEFLAAKLKACIERVEVKSS
jgi:amino acid adenylation domain-containing protein